MELKNILINKCAVSNTTGKSDFFIIDNLSIIQTPVMSLKKNILTNKTIEVQTINFGQYIKQFKKIDFCKIDIEGGESMLLKSLIDSGTISIIKEIVVEFHLWVNQEYNVKEFKSIFESYGFSTKILKSEPMLTNWPTSGNVVFRFTNNN